jgi:hypothetical protein
MNEEKSLIGKIDKFQILHSIPKSKTIVISICILFLLIIAIILIVVLIIWSQSNISYPVFLVNQCIINI